MWLCNSFTLFSLLFCLLRPLALSLSTQAQSPAYSVWVCCRAQRAQRVFVFFCSKFLIKFLFSGWMCCAVCVCWCVCGVACVCAFFFHSRLLTHSALTFFLLATTIYTTLAHDFVLAHSTNSEMNRLCYYDDVVIFVHVINKRIGGT